MGQSSDTVVQSGDPGMLKNTGVGEYWDAPWTPAPPRTSGTFTTRDRLMLERVYEMLKRLESVMFRDKEVSDLGDLGGK